MKTISRIVNRLELLALLESVSPGLSVRDYVEQSSCFVFDRGEVMTYNGDIACRAPTSLVKLKGAVQASPFKAILEKMPDDELHLATKKGELVIEGKRRTASIRMEHDVQLPIKKVEKPKKFKPLHPNFIDAIEIAHECTGKDEQKFWTTCIHLHPKWIESCDGAQVTRYKLKTGIERGTLVRARVIKCITTLDMSKFSETPQWIHFKNKQGLLVSCLRYIEDYPIEALTRMLKVDDGVRTPLPKGMGEAAERAAIFSSEHVDNNLIEIELTTGKLTVKGEGVSGSYVERKKLKYKGHKMNFLISPTLLQELTRRHDECEITEDRLKINGGKYVYVNCLSKTGAPADDKESQEQETDDGDSESEDDDSEY